MLSRYTHALYVCTVTVAVFVSCLCSWASCMCRCVCFSRRVCVCVCVWPSPLRDRFFRRHVDTRVLAVTTAGRGEKSCARHMSCYHHCSPVNPPPPPPPSPTLSTHTHIFPWFSLYPAATGERCRFNGG